MINNEILDKIKAKVREASDLLQWSNRIEVIDWFR